MIQLFKTFFEYLLIPKMSPGIILNKSLSNMHCWTLVKIIHKLAPSEDEV